MKIQEFVEFLKAVKFENAEVEIKEGEIIIKESFMPAPTPEDMEAYDLILTIVRSPESIKKIANGYEIDASKFGNALKLWKILTAVLGSQYKIEIPDTYTVVVTFDNSQENPINKTSNPSTGNQKFQYKKESEDKAIELAKMVEEKFPESEIIITDENLTIKNCDLESAAKLIEAHLPDVEGELNNEELIIKL